MIFLGGILIIAVLMISAAAAALIRLSRIITRMETMIEDGITGELEEKSYDETRMSRMESRMYQFINSGELGRNKLQNDRDRIGTLVSDISHQTKTPVTSIRIYSELLLEKQLPAEQQIMLEQIHEQNERLAFLIDNLVKISRLENDIICLKQCRRSLRELYERLKSSVRIPEKKQYFLEDGQEWDTEGCYDLKWTQEALGNIIDNAFKYTSDGGIVRVSIKAYHMFVSITVTDNGIGIAEVEQAAIFGRFYRSQEVKDEKGLGIGLYLAREIAVRQGGFIKVESETGAGSSFSFYISE